MNTTGKIRIGDLLLAEGVLGQEVLNDALAEQKRTGRKLGQVLVDRGAVSEQALLETLSRQLNIPLIDPRQYRPDVTLAALIPEAQARRFRVVALARDGNEVVIGTSDPTNSFALEELSKILARPFRLALFRDADLQLAMDQLYGSRIPPVSAGSAAPPGDVVAASAESRVNLYGVHLLSAALFSRRVGELEAQHAGKGFGVFWEEIFTNASAAVFACISALEAYINEFFMYRAGFPPGSGNEAAARIRDLCEARPVVEKYELALLLKNGAVFDRGAAPYQDVIAVVKLRNALLHFRSEWLGGQVPHARLSDRIEGHAARSPFLPESESLFPRAWASHGTTRWVVHATLAFILDFEQRAGIESRVAALADRLQDA